MQLEDALLELLADDYAYAYEHSLRRSCPTKTAIGVAWIEVFKTASSIDASSKFIVLKHFSLSWLCRFMNEGKSLGFSR